MADSSQQQLLVIRGVAEGDVQRERSQPGATVARGDLDRGSTESKPRVE